ncbi:translation initiation factor eIF2B delta subunit [Schizosaccharomyces pombe]|uniref:Translation initiation factor eIF2B subunit delta n=1 Tax=Schizosaccharomyces pombe (strain 972 / ATCC 24843) TaxID=284812 RepID=EI2BD_SCHPO|nr:putative translation initiation factor eIF2B delta subunit tif224 [Schizosaccharomyces pombe]Q09924.1 RecName: Full=Translation initiation factor eIF2B subunit delta; AltName: Full=eIF2B GDP-GTP exchange factor subunit delta [Schizosaccharomyces pombe 972h-]5B04_G Chain G, Probable translation initiation factor eIF-2B subunit delta [Schizosaccharomyces pombe 972h-]5B04_H Chain H, Probable translation initiation factor eIF-2B subunit delta [Schizosaccharomyces pombe 972h-]6JLY_G Chain G, Prob|eukprot:NP_594503.1 putative translation initiation factor eIF2B delta subunit tif224 [Schizosaccharomyces pombe]
MGFSAEQAKKDGKDQSPVSESSSVGGTSPATASSVVSPNEPKLSGKEAKALKKARKQASRRAKAEAAAANNPPGVSEEKKVAIPNKNSNQQKKASKQNPQNSPETDANLQEKKIFEEKQVSIFSHLDWRRRRTTENIPKDIHPAVIRLGLKLANYKIFGSNQRCIDLLKTFKIVIQDYQTPYGTTLSRHLTTHINSQIAYLVSTRPLSISMGNAIRFLKLEISVLDIDLTDDEGKELLLEKIDSYIRDRIIIAGQVIVQAATEKIQDGDVILTYLHSSTVNDVLIHAKNVGKKFRVVVVDSRPEFEGRVCLKLLTEHGIECTYVMISALSYIMQEVTKIFLGGHAMLSNGALYSRAGTSLISLLGHESNVPVIACCESYKFTERIQLDSLVYNELAPGDQLVNMGVDDFEEKPGVLANWKSVKNLKLLSLKYDVTPPRLITVCVCEMGLLPSTSVPAIINEFKQVYA